jgi:hypothetical protein
MSEEWNWRIALLRSILSTLLLSSCFKRLCPRSRSSIFNDCADFDLLFDISVKLEKATYYLQLPSVMYPKFVLKSQNDAKRTPTQIPLCPPVSPFFKGGIFSVGALTPLWKRGEGEIFFGEIEGWHYAANISYRTLACSVLV